MEIIYIGLGIIILFVAYIASYFYSIAKSQIRINKLFIEEFEYIINALERAYRNDKALEKSIELTDGGLSILYNSYKELNEKSNSRKTKSKARK